MSLPRKLVSDTVKSLRHWTDDGVVSIRQNKHIKLSGKLKGRKWVFMVPCSPQPHYSHKLHHINLTNFIHQLKKMTNMHTFDKTHEELMENTNAITTKNTKTLTEVQTGTRQKIASYKGNLDDYYMVDYHVEVDSFMKWVRSPFKTLEEVAQIANSIHNRKGISNFRILPEKWLSQLRDNTWNDETNSYTKDDITNRVWVFGSFYEELAEHITGETSLMRN
jgi:hypothetical protein